MSSETPVLAETSYGCQKQIIELYVYDYGRKGFLETRSVRLPTVAIRSGAVRPLPHTVLMIAIIRGIIVHLWFNQRTASRPGIGSSYRRRSLGLYHRYPRILRL